MRQLLAAAAAAAVAMLGAFVVGEYELAGVTGPVAGVLFGIVVGEVAVAVARQGGALLAAAAAAAAAAGLLGAAWISSGRDWSFVPAPAWVGVALSAVTAGAWVTGFGPRRAGSRRAP